jgi:hypothetical protein
MLSHTVSTAGFHHGRSTAASRLLLATLALFLFSIPALTHPALAQSTAGRILGTVTDQSGAAVSGATVVVSDVQRGDSRTLTTDTAGEYVAPELLPGAYKIRVEPRASRRSSVPIRHRGCSDVRADFALQPGQVSETIVVNVEVPLLNTTSSTLGGTLSNEEINDLPLNGRNYENLLQLRPGVMRYPGGGFSTTSANGLRAEDNAYFVEGLFNSEPFPARPLSTEPASPAIRRRFFPLMRFRNSTCSRVRPPNMDGNPERSSMWG